MAEKWMEKGAQKNGYIPWVDVAKGLGVCLVILGHLLYSTNLELLNQAVYSFHMPVFFLLAGFVVNTEKESTSRFIRKKFFTLLLPAYLLIFLTLPFYYLDIRGEGKTLGEILRCVFYVDGQVAYNTPCWFFIALFEVSAAAKIMNLSARSGRYHGISMLVAAALGYVLQRFELFPYFGADKAVIAFVFYVFGHWMRQVRPDQLSGKARIGAGAAVTVLWILVALVLNGKTSMYHMEFGNYWLFLAGAILGSLSFLFLCQSLGKAGKIFENWGKNTVFVVGTHSIYISIFNLILGKLGWSGTAMAGALAVLSVPILMLVYMPVCKKVVNPWLPVLNGKYTGRKNGCKD